MYASRLSKIGADRSRHDQDMGFLRISAQSPCLQFLSRRSLRRSTPNFLGLLLRRSQALVQSIEWIALVTWKILPFEYCKNGTNLHSHRALDISETRQWRKLLLADNSPAMCASKLPKNGVNRSSDQQDMGFLRYLHSRRATKFRPFVCFGP